MADDNRGQPMKVRRMVVVLLTVLVSGPARANPVSYGQQLCVMLASGISQQKAWDYIVHAHTKAAIANPQTVIPWYSAASAGWAMGTALANAEAAQQEMIAMRPDVFKVARNACPKQFH